LTIVFRLRVNHPKDKGKKRVKKRERETEVVYHLPKKPGNFGWDVNGKTVLVCPNGNFPK